MLEPMRGLWVGDRLSTIQRLSIRSFLHHGHPFQLYIYNHVAGIPDGTTVLDANTVLPQSAVFAYKKGIGKGSYSAFSNVFRYKMLRDLGGWWVDLDTVALRPFEFHREYVFGKESGNTVACGVIRVPPGSDLMRRCFAQADAWGQDIHWGQAGPSLLTAKVLELGLLDQAEPPAVFYPVHFARFHLLLQPRTPLPSAATSCAVHLWHEMWRRAGKDPDAAYDPTSMYEQLKSTYLSGT